MATPRAATEQPRISRTYRAAIRLGEDYLTLEETITLASDASDDEIIAAVDLGWRIYTHQRAAVELQVAEIRAGMAAIQPVLRLREPEAPASDRQRNYIATLQSQLGWTSDQLTAYAGEQAVDLGEMTKGQASVFIDSLRHVLN